MAHSSGLGGKQAPPHSTASAVLLCSPAASPAHITCAPACRFRAWISAPGRTCRGSPPTRRRSTLSCRWSSTWDETPGRGSPSGEPGVTGPQVPLRGECSRPSRAPRAREPRGIRAFGAGPACPREMNWGQRIKRDPERGEIGHCQAFAAQGACDAGRCPGGSCRQQAEGSQLLSWA